MRVLACGLAALLACSAAARAADDDLDKVLVGKWKMKTLGVEEKDVFVEKSIEFTRTATTPG
jgi:hypothetical protein